MLVAILCVATFLSPPSLAVPGERKGRGHPSGESPGKGGGKPIVEPGPGADDGLPEPLLFDDFTEHAVDVPWDEGSTQGVWLPVFDGYGSIAVRDVDDDRVLELSPQAASAPDETHGALVVTAQRFADHDLQVAVRTIDQLRAGEPNPWETGWVIWGYSDNTHFYYLALKTNGWELGKADPAYPGAQRFLADGRDVTFALGQTVHVRIEQVGNSMTVWVDGTQLVVYVDDERPYLDGAVGLYTEDATVWFDDVIVTHPTG